MLSAPTPKAMLGEAVAALTKLGLSEVHFELMTDVPAFARNNSGHEIKATDFLEAFIADHPTFSQKDVTAAFKADGRLPSASYYAMTKLLEQGSIKKLDDDGNYSRADIKQIEAPKKEKTKEKPARDHFDVDHREFILRYARQHNGRFSLAKLREHFVKNKRKPASIGGAVHYLLTTKKAIKALGGGEFVLVSKAEPKTKKPAAKLNGADEPATTEEVTNG
jgi:hypothetical protein